MNYIEGAILCLSEDGHEVFILAYQLECSLGKSLDVVF